MAKSYNLTLQLNLQGPNNINKVTANLKKQLQSVGGSLKIDISKGSLGSIDNATKKLIKMGQALKNANTNAAALNTTFRQLGNAISSVNSVNTNINKTAGALQKTTKVAKQATEEVKSFWEEIIGRANYQAKFNTINAALSGTTQAIQLGIDSLVEYERNLNKLTQLNVSSSAIGDLDKQIRKLSSGLGVSSVELSNVSVVLKQAGNSATDTTIALKALSQASLAPTFSNMTNAVEGAVAVMSQFNLEAKDLERALDSINTVAGSFAVEFDDIVSAIRRGGGAFSAAASEGKTAQQNLNEFVSLFSTIRSATRESSETIATGLRTITARLQKVSTQKGLKDLIGVDLSKDGKFIGTYEAIEEIGQRIKELNITGQDLRFSQIVEQIGGIRQFSRVIPLLQRTTETSKILEAAQNSGGSTAKSAAQAQTTFRVQLEKTRESFISLVAAAAQGDALFNGFGSLASATKGLLAFTRAILDTTKAIAPFLPLIVAVSAIKFGKSLFAPKAAAGGGIGGLLGGLGGGSAGVSPGGAGGGGGNGLTNATQKLTAEVSTNTAAINKLTSAINGLGSKPTIGLARGGVVPGTGSGDTVPAMLTPGEFVIRKDAVKALGTERLHEMNKYASGGPILKENKVGAVILSGNAGNTGKNTIDRQIILDEFGNESTQKFLKDKIPKNKTFELVRNPLSKDKAPLFTSAINEGLIQAVNTSARKLATDLGMEENSRAIKDKVNRTEFLSSVNDGARGNLFEQLIDAAAKTANPLYESSGAQDPFDFVGPMGSALDKLFPDVASITYKDGKASYIAASPDNFAKKIGNQVLQEHGFTSGAVAGGGSKSLYDKVLEQFTSDSTKIEGAVLQKNRNITGTLLQEMVDEGKLRLTEGSRGKRFYEKLAKGGSVSDTVPAMLTPGEFVINKKAAARIGGAQLEKLNKADKIQGFKKGGAVGGLISRMTGGGGAVYDTLVEESGGDVLAFEKSLNKQIRQLAKGITDAVEKSKTSFIKEVGRAGAQKAAGKINNKEIYQQSKSLVDSLSSTSGFSDSSAINKAAKDLTAGLIKGLSFEEILTSSKDLSDVFNSTKDSSIAFEEAIQQVSLSTGLTIQQLTQMNQSIAAELMPTFTKWGQVLNNTISGIQGFVKNVAGAGSAFGKSVIAIQRVFSKITYAATGLATAITATGYLDANQTQTSMEVLGAASAGTFTGQQIGSLFGPVGTAIGGLIGGLGAGITQYFRSSELRELEKAQQKLAGTTVKLDNAMSKLSETPNNEVLQGRALEQIKNLSDQSGSLEAKSSESRGLTNDPRAYFEAFSAASIQSLEAAERYAETVLKSKMSYEEAQDALAQLNSGVDSYTALESSMSVQAGVMAKLGAAYDTATDAEKERVAQEVINEQSRAAFFRLRKEQGIKDSLIQKEWNEQTANSLFVGRQELIQKRMLNLETMRAVGAVDALNYQFKKIDIYMSRIAPMVTRFTTELDQLTDSAENMVSSLSGSGAAYQPDRSRENILSNSDAYSIREFSRAAREASQGNNQLAAGAITSEVISRQIIPLIRSAGDVNQDNVGDLIRSSLAQTFGAQDFSSLPDDIKESMNDVIEQITSNFGGEEGGAERAIQQLQGLADSSKTQRDALLAIEKARIGIIQKQASLMSRQNELIQRNIELYNESIQRTSDFNVMLKEFGGQDVSLAELNAGFEGQIQNLTGGRSSSDVGGIAADFNALKLQQQQINNNLKNLEAQPATDQNLVAIRNLQEKQQDIQNSMDNRLKALNKIKDDGSRAANAMKKLSEQRDKAKSAKDVIDKLLSGDFDQIFEASQSIDDALAARTGNTDYFASRPGSYNRLQSSGILNMFSSSTRNQMTDVGLQGAGQAAGLGSGMMRFVNNINRQARGDTGDPLAQQAAQAVRDQNEAAGAIARINEEIVGKLDRFIDDLAVEYPYIVADAFWLARQDIRAAVEAAANPAQGLNSGGVVYSSSGGMAGANKDTVPAMLTPGEYVINREATKKHRGLIESINSGEPLYLDTGGGPVGKTKQQVDQERRERAEAWKQNNRSSSQTPESRQRRRESLDSIAKARIDIQGSRNMFSTAPTPEGVVQPGMGLIEFEDAFTRAFGPGLPEKHPRYQEFYDYWQEQKMKALDTRIAESRTKLQAESKAEGEAAVQKAIYKGNQLAAQQQQEKTERDRQKSADLVNRKAKMFVEDRGTLYTTLENGAVETWTSKDGKFSANGVFQGLTSKGGIKIRLEGNDEQSGRENGQIIVLDAQALDASSVARAGNGVDALYQQHRDITNAQSKARTEEKIEVLRAEQAAKRQKETDRAKLFAEKEAASIQTSTDLFAATESELNRLINVEQSALDANEETLQSKGFLGRMFGSGLQEGDIALAKQKITRYNTGLAKIAEARAAYGRGKPGMYNSVDLSAAQEAFDAARRLAVMPAVMLGTGQENLDATPTAGAGLKKVNTKEYNARVQEELNQIEAQKENAVNLTLAVAAPIAGVAAAPTAVGGALSALTTVGTAKSLSNYDSYAGGMKTASEAAIDTLTETGLATVAGSVAPGVSAAAGKVLKPVLDVAGKGVSKAAQAASPFVKSAGEAGKKTLDATLKAMGTSTKEISDDLVKLGLKKAPVKLPPTGGAQTIGGGIKGQVANSNSLIQVRGARPGATQNLFSEGAENFTYVIDDSMANFDELAANFNMSTNTIAPKGGFAGGRANFGERMGGRLYRGADGSISTSMPGTAAPRGGSVFRAGVYSDEALAPQSLIGKGDLAKLARERAARQAENLAQADDLMSATSSTYGPFPAVDDAIGSSPTFKPSTQAEPYDFFGHGVDQAAVDDYLGNITKPLSDYVSPTNFGVAPDDLIGGDFGGSVTRSQIDAIVKQAQENIKNRELLKIIKEATKKPRFDIGRTTLGVGAAGFGLQELGGINIQDIKDLPKLLTGFNKGGPVYARNGMFVPKGTDTVPAMLTPGEFVVNRKATQENRGLLEAINGGSPIYRRRGGAVYMQRGGEANGGMSMDFSVFNTSVNNFVGSASQFFDASNNFVGGVASFAEKIGSFTSYVDKLSNLKLPNVPDRIEMVGTHSVTVELRGAQVLEGMQEWAERLVSGQITEKFRELWEKTGGQLGSAR